jgi:hypothetical protein
MARLPCLGTASLRRQRSPLRRWHRIVAACLPEQVERLCPGPMMVMKPLMAAHGSLPDSGRERLSMRLKPGDSRMRDPPPRHRSHRAMPAVSGARRHPPEGAPRPVPACKQPGRASRPAVPATGPKHRRRGCSGRHRRPPSRSPHECERGIPPRDASSTEPRPPRSRGRSVVFLYDRVRSHQGRWCYGKTPMQTFLDTAGRQGGNSSRRDDVGHPNLSDTHHDRRPSDQIHTSTEGYLVL